VGTPQESVKLGPTRQQCKGACHYMLIHSSCTLTARLDIRWWILCHLVVHNVLSEESITWVMVMLCCSEHPFEDSDSFPQAEYNWWYRMSRGVWRLWNLSGSHLYRWGPSR